MTETFAAIARRLRITRPLICVDLETTGKVPGVDRIIQVGIMRAQPNGDVREWASFVDPEIDIPAEATLAHKITNEMVADAPAFQDLAPMLATGLSDCDFVGQHVKFDLRVLEAEFQRIGLRWSYADAAILDTLRIDQIKDPRTLEALLKKYCDEDHPEAHEALADVRAAVNVLAGEFRAYPDLPQTVTDLHALLWPRDPHWVDEAGKVVWRNHEACIGFGKWNGVPLKSVPKDYLAWIAGANFPDDVKAIARNALDHKFPIYVPPALQREAA